MNRKTMRVVTGANLVAGCLLLQGCGLFGGKDKPDIETGKVLPSDPVIEVQSTGPAVTPRADFETTRVAPKVETRSLDLPEVPMTTSYSIRKGDTISTIAARYGVRWQDIVALNPGIKANSLRVGQIIQLPGQINVAKPAPVASKPAISKPVTAKPANTTAPAVKKAAAAPAAPVATQGTYKVKSGDSLSVIAARHHVKTADLKSANGLKNDFIRVGQTLKIPAAAAAPVAVKSVAPAQKAKPANVTAPKVPSRTVKPVEPAKATVAPVVKPETAKPAETAPTPAKPAEPAPAMTVTPAPAATSTATEPATAKPAEPAPAKPAEPAVAKPATPPEDTYIVKENEDLYSIAIRWGVSPSTLRELNKLDSGAELKPGQELKIPRKQD